MVTVENASSLASVLFGKTRRAVLALLLCHADESFYVRQISRIAVVGMGALQRELKLLSDAGIVRRISRGMQVYYQADPECPIFEELRSLVVKTFGIGDVIRNGLSKVADRIIVAFLFGSLVRGDQKEDSDADVMVVGSVAFAEIVSALAPVQKALNREVNPTVYPPDEFREKVREGHHFLNSVLDEEKVFIIGDADELEGLVG